MYQSAGCLQQPLKSGNVSHLAIMNHEKGFITAKAYQINRGENLNILCLLVLIWRQNGSLRSVARSSIAATRSFTTKYSVPSQIKPRILNQALEKKIIKQQKQKANKAT